MPWCGGFSGLDFSYEPHPDGLIRILAKALGFDLDVSLSRGDRTTDG